MIFVVFVLRLIYVNNVYSFKQNYEVLQNERIITDLNIINGIQGVPIDYNWYNETHTGISFTSVPGCPKSTDGLPWIYFGNPAKCFLAGQKGPCDDKEVLLINFGSPHGTCGCECLNIVQDQIPDFRYKYCKKKDEFGYGQIYDTREHRCYTNGFSQGPCVHGSLVYQLLDGNTLNCIPLCSPSYNTQKDDKCLGPWGAGSIGKINTMIQCEPDQKYSSILRKCIPNLRLSSTQIGK